MKTPVTLYEVIAFDSAFPDRALGVTFTDPHDAQLYADVLENIGLKTELSPAFETYEDAESALKTASAYFNRGKRHDA